MRGFDKIKCLKLAEFIASSPGFFGSKPRGFHFRDYVGFGLLKSAAFTNLKVIVPRNRHEERKNRFRIKHKTLLAALGTPVKQRYEHASEKPGYAPDEDEGKGIGEDKWSKVDLWDNWYFHFLATDSSPEIAKAWEGVEERGTEHRR
jgi:hypothetical protein